jgi:hypothetical protein
MKKSRYRIASHLLLRLAESGTPHETFDVLAEATGRCEDVRSNHSRKVDGIGDSFLRPFVAICL